MEPIDNIQQLKIYVEAELVSPGCWQFVWTDRDKKEFVPEFDFQIPVLLTRTNEVYEYVQIDKDDEIEPIIRQEINPYFHELSFFDSIEQNKVLRGSDLTTPMINKIRDVRPETAEFSNSEVRDWFDQIGINEFPWNKGTSTETTLDDLDVLTLSSDHIISKANYFNIDINK